MNEFREKILIVEDSKEILETILMAYENDPVKEILLAENGMEALEVLKHNEVHLILTDLNMPKMNGVDFAREVRENLIDTPIVVVSGNNNPKEYEKLLRVGISDFVHKPFELGDLVVTIETHMNKEILRSLERELVDHYFSSKEPSYSEYRELSPPEKITILLKSLGY